MILFYLRIRTLLPLGHKVYPRRFILKLLVRLHSHHHSVLQHRILDLDGKIWRLQVRLIFLEKDHQKVFLQALPCLWLPSGHCTETSKIFSSACAWCSWTLCFWKEVKIFKQLGQSGEQTSPLAPGSTILSWNGREERKSITFWFVRITQFGGFSCVHALKKDVDTADKYPGHPGTTGRYHHSTVTALKYYGSPFYNPSALVLSQIPGWYKRVIATPSLKFVTMQLILISVVFLHHLRLNVWAFKAPWFSLPEASRCFISSITKLWNLLTDNDVYTDSSQFFKSKVNKLIISYLAS